MTEREFLIQLAILRFNTQFNKQLKISDFDIRSILPNKSSVIGYEIFSVRLDDYLRLRLYLNFGNHDDIGKYRLEIDGSNAPNALGDEVYVSSGHVSRRYIDNGLYKFRWLLEDPSRWNILLTETGGTVLTESGQFILTESGV